MVLPLSNPLVIRMNNAKARIETIDDYISKFPQDIRDVLEELRKAIKESAPNAQETISYGIPTFKLNGNLVHFGAFKTHIGFYPGGPSAVEAFKKDLLEYKHGKGSIQFPLDKPLPLQLVKRIVKFRVEENERK